MIPYKSKSGKKSGVTAYQIGNDYITVQFENRETYTYTIESAGLAAINAMKRLALKSTGLSTFISRHKPGFI